MNMNIEQVKNFAQKRYERGGDVIIECWTDADIIEKLLSGVKSKKAWKSIFDEYYYERLDVQKFIW